MKYHVAYGLVDTKAGLCLWHRMYDVAHIILQREHTQSPGMMTWGYYFLFTQYDLSFLEPEFFVCLLFLTARERKKKHGFRLLECLPRGVGAAGRRKIKQRRTYFFCVRLFIHPFHQCPLSAYYVLERPALQKF